MALHQPCGCGNTDRINIQERLNVQEQILLEQARGNKFIQIFCGSMAGLMPVLLVVLPYIAAWHGKTIPTTENNVVLTILGGYSLVLTAMFGASQKAKIVKVADALKEMKS